MVIRATARQRTGSLGGRLRAAWTLAAVMTAAALTVPTKAQIPAVATQFDMTGFIQQATLDRPNDIFSGGTITVNNVKIIVPYYTILQMPAFALTWQELFTKAPAPYTGLQTGLAMQDIPKPKYTYEVQVVGNRLPDGSHIAGLLFISQQSLHSGQGWITSINYATGEITVDGITRVKPNDPIARFSKGFGTGVSPDQRFTIDEDNPTVRASSSYPMCIPRVAPPAIDALCPQKNRRLDREYFVGLGDCRRAQSRGLQRLQGRRAPAQQIGRALRRAAKAAGALQFGASDLHRGADVGCAVRDRSQSRGDEGAHGAANPAPSLRQASRSRRDVRLPALG